MKERDPFQEDAVGLLRVEEEQVLPAPTSTCSTGGSSTGCSVEICSVWDPWAAGGQPAPPGASPQAAGELLLFPFLDGLSHRRKHHPFCLTSGQQRVPLEPPGTGPYLTWGSCCILLTEDTPAAPRYQNLSS